MEAFNDIFEDCTSLGTKISKDNYLSEGKYIVVDQGQNIIAGYTNEEDGLYEDVPAIVFGDHTRIIKYVDEPFFLGADGVKLLKSKKKDANYKYLYYALKNARIPDTGYNRHFKWLKEVNIEYPEPDKQQKIVEVLDKISRVIEERKLELQQLDELIKARFVEMFGDPVENPKGYRVDTLQDLIDAGDITYHLDGNHGGDYPRSEEFVSEGVPYIGANCISNGEIDFSLAKYLTVERAGKLRKGIAQNEDVLFAHNATVGPTVVLHTTEPKVILSTSLTAYRCNKESIMPEYLATYMKSDGFVMQYSSEMKQTTRNQVPITAQKKYLFLIPPMEEQKAFSEFVKQVDKSKVVVQKALDEAQLLFDSLMQDYFG